jgi:prepilin-type N-terminal cleavage/methylation domain-containing protein
VRAQRTLCSGVAAYCPTVPASFAQSDREQRDTEADLRCLSPGFTLIELLVVIAIVVVVIAILLPSLSAAREAGRRARCMGNLRQLQTAWYAYAVDHGDFIVNGQPGNGLLAADNDGDPWLVKGDWGPSGPPNASGGERLMRTGALASYVADVRVYMCPTRIRHVLNPNVHPASEYLSSYSIGITMNALSPLTWVPNDRKIRAQYDVGKIVLFVRKTSELTATGPSARMVFMDWGFGYGWGRMLGAWGLAGQQPEHWADLNFASLPVHHGHGTCLSFADGHSEYWKWKDPATIPWGHAWEQVLAQGPEKVHPPPWPPDWTPMPPQADSPDVVRLHRAIWGK